MFEVTSNHKQIRTVPFKEFEFGGLRLHSVNHVSVNRYVQDLLAARRVAIIYGYSLTIIPKLREMPEIATLGNQFDVLIPDGKGLFWMANFFGAKLESHLSLPDLVAQLLVLANEKQYRVFLLGATKEINEKAQENIRQKFSKLQVKGRDGYFKPEEHDQIFDNIRAFGADIILIGISSPLKEKLALSLYEKLSSGVVIPCGGVIDILGGKTTREHAVIKKIGMTWFYRFVQEPKRLFKPLVMSVLYFGGVLFPLLIWEKKFCRNRAFTFLGWFGK